MNSEASIPGFVAREVEEELPGLRLRHLSVLPRGGRERPSAAERLRILSDRMRGPAAVALRTTPVAHAYRAFFRQVGSDPDATPVPIERAAIARLRDGALRSAGAIADACLVALVETGVPVWALDARLVDAATLGIRLADPSRLGDPWGVRAPAGTLVIADAMAVRARLFEDPLRQGAGAPGRALRLYCVGVAGIPELRIEEALWCASQLL